MKSSVCVILMFKLEVRKYTDVCIPNEEFTPDCSDNVQSVWVSRSYDQISLGVTVGSFLYTADKGYILLVSAQQCKTCSLVFELLTTMCNIFWNKVLTCSSSESQNTAPLLSYVKQTFNSGVDIHLREWNEQFSTRIAGKWMANSFVNMPLLQMCWPYHCEYSFIQI